VKKQPRITRISAASSRRLKGKTDWRRVKAMGDAEIGRAVARDPDQSFAGAEFWRTARLVLPAPKEKVSLRLDRDVLDFFRRSGRRYQTRINGVLRAFMQAQSGPR
jgi:uncharacterized protein (DUF4415 family)